MTMRAASDILVNQDVTIKRLAMRILRFFWAGVLTAVMTACSGSGATSTNSEGGSDGIAQPPSIVGQPDIDGGDATGNPVDQGAESQAGCSIQSTPVETRATQQQCDGLLALYESTIGPNWHASGGWNTASDPCEWHGVSCDLGGVVQLNLGSNQLTGSLSESFAMDNLQTIIMWSNPISGAIPDLNFPNKVNTLVC